MTVVIRAAQGALVLMAALAFYETWICSFGNGTFTTITKTLESNAKNLPGSKEPIRTHYTGVAAIDQQLQVLAVFFWPIVNGQNPIASMHGSSFAGQFATGHLLVSLEGMRKANRGRLISYILIWGIFFQNVAFAVTVPVMLAVHLATSPTILPSIPEILPSAAEVAALPVSIALGFWVPSYLMSLPLSQIDANSKQLYLAIWQPFPLWVSLSQQVLKRVFAGFSGDLSRSSRTATTWALRFAYGFALATTAFTHISTLAQATHHDKAPTLFTKGIDKHMGIQRTFVPAAYDHKTLSPDLAEGALLFLQWDYIFGAGATLLWAATLLARSKPVQGSTAGLVGLILTSSLGFVVSGPIGLATILLWIRDEVVLGRTASPIKKTN